MQKPGTADGNQWMKFDSALLCYNKELGIIMVIMLHDYIPQNPNWESMAPRCLWAIVGRGMRPETKPGRSVDRRRGRAFRTRRLG